ncbi:MAG: aldolase catalytic domain-containing protein [Clostridiales bacterium]|nr:aldolase catalytic domain-containing protein [Clostridiales bacterium]
MRINVLDCTLRDGGYVNDFNFGASTIEKIKSGFCDANIDIIECGFLQSGKNDPERSLYGAAEQIKLPPNRDAQMFVAMIAFGDISASEIAKRQSDYIDGIRLTFHNSEWEETKALAQNLMDKGYKVFIQPVGTLSYTDEELLALIKQVNELKPFAFYLVDTLGSMYKNDLMRLFFLVEHNLADGIALGFHSHNNMQLSFSNAMSLLELHTQRYLIIDSSIFGMGRGAGNLNTELITHYINSNIENRYNITPLLDLMDEIILPIYKYTPWGFSEPYYMAAIRGVHPNYASYLIDKQSMSMAKISRLLDVLPQNNRHLFKKSLIEEVYFADMRHTTNDAVALKNLREIIGVRAVLVAVPGSSVKTHADSIGKYIAATNSFVISVNFVPEQFTPDLVFIGNQRRYGQLRRNEIPVIVSSNIDAQNAFVIDYDSLRSGSSDSSGLMALRLLIQLDIKSAALAGYDGFSAGTNYYGKTYDNYLSGEAIENLNENMETQLRKIHKRMKLNFVTPTAYRI